MSTNVKLGCLPYDRLGNAGWVFFSRNTLLDELTSIITKVEFPCIGLYYKVSKNPIKYECWYLDICSINKTSSTKTSLSKLYNDPILKNIAIKSIKKSHNDILEIKLRFAISKLMVKNKISLIDTISETFGYGKDISKTPLQIIIQIYEFIDKSNSFEPAYNTHIMMDKYKLNDGDQKQQDQRFQIIQLLGQSFQENIRYESSISYNITKLLEDTIYFEALTYLKIPEYSLSDIELASKSKIISDRRAFKSYMDVLIDMLLNDLEFRKVVLEGYNKPIHKLMNIYNIDSGKDSDSVDRYIFGTSINIYFKYWNIVSILLNSCLNTGIFDITSYNRYLELVSNDVDIDYSDYKLDPNHDIIFNYDLDLIYNKSILHDNIPTIHFNMDHYIPKDEIRILYKILKKLTIDFSKLIYTGNARQQFNIYELELYLKKARRILDIFNTCTIDLLNYKQHSYKINFETSHDNTFINLDGSTIDNYISDFHILWATWNQILTILQPIYCSTAVPKEHLDLLLNRFYDLSHTDINHRSYIQSEGTMVISNGHKYKFIDNLEHDFEVKSGRVSHYKFIFYNKFIGKLFANFINELNTYIKGYLIGSKWSYTLFTQKCNQISSYINQGLKKLLLNENIDNIDFLPNKLLSDWTLHFYSKNNFYIDPNYFKEIHHEFINLLTEHNYSNIPILHFNKIAKAFNHINTGLHLNLPPIKHEEYTPFSTVVSFDDSYTVTQQFLLSNGKKVNISLNQPHLEDIDHNHLEEILEAINCMTKDDYRLNNLQSKIVKELTNK